MLKHEGIHPPGCLARLYTTVLVSNLKTQTTNVVSNRNINQTETTESRPSTEVMLLQTSLPTISTLISGSKTPLKNPKKKLFEAIVTFIVIQINLKNLLKILKIILLVQLLIVCIFKTLQLYCCHNSKRLKVIYQCIIH